jgi:hypothetical protein
MNARRRRAGRREAGSLLVPVLLLSLILVPLLFIMSSSLRVHNRHSFQDRALRTSRTLSQNMVLDYMRQFSEDYRGEHYHPDWLKRDVTRMLSSYVGGVTVSEVNEEINPLYTRDYVRARRMMALRSHGRFRGRETQAKGNQALISFVSNWARFGLVAREDLKVDGNSAIQGQTLSGGLWVGDRLDLHQVLRINGAPFAGVFTSSGVAVVRSTAWRHGGGNLILQNGATLNYGGFSNVGGTNFIPPELFRLDPPFSSADFNYYRLHNSTAITASMTITFDSNQIDFGGVAQTFPWNVPVVIYSEGFNVVLRQGPGRIDLPVTVVVRNADVTIDGPLVYGGGQITATPGHSLAVITDGDLTFKNAGGDTCGFFFAAEPTKRVWFRDSDRTIRGTLITAPDELRSASGGRLLDAIPDPGLSTSPPPGLPERPVLVKFRPTSD